MEKIQNEHDHGHGYGARRFSGTRNGEFPELTMRLLEKLGSGEVGVKIDQEELVEFTKRIGSQEYKRLVATIAIIILMELFN